MAKDYPETEEEIKEWLSSLSDVDRKQYQEDMAATDEYLRRYYAELWRDEKLRARNCKVISMSDWLSKKKPNE